MTISRSLSSLVSGAANTDAALNEARFSALSRQIPVLYSILIMNTVTIAWTHHGLAPTWLSVHAPLALCSAAAARLVVWWRARKLVTPPGAIARRLRATTLLAGALGILFSMWALSLFPYGGPYERGHVAFYMTVTVLASALCLSHLPAAVLALAATAIAPTAGFFATLGNPTLQAIALNMTLVSIAMAFVIFIYYRDFVALARAKEVVTERQAETQRLSDENFHIANIDALTGLPNRRQFFSALGEAFAEAETRRQSLAIGLIDLDGFKPVNDVYGHAIGDRLLRLVAERVSRLLGKDVTLARLGGDEFGLIVRAPGDEAVVLGLGERISASLKQSFDLPQVRVQIAASIGFAIYPKAAATAELLYERADYALYNAKETKRGGVALFTDQHERNIREQSETAQRLRAADLEAELWVAFQPIVDARLGRAIGFEALGRWKCPTAGEVAPDVFVRLAERYNMVNDLTCLLLRKTLTTIADWPRDMRVSFNLSAFDLASPDAMTKIIATLERAPAAVERIDFEITETAVFVDFEQARRSIEALKALGARISLDDFGCGYSSLAYVQKLPLDRIKIDRGFVADIETDKASRQIVKTIVDLCRNMEIPCVAEGVETQAQLDVLAALDCHLVQGYFYARPMAAQDVPAFMLRSIAPRSAVAAPALKVA